MAELRNEIASKIVRNPEEYSRADIQELSEEIEQIKNKIQYSGNMILDY